MAAISRAAHEKFLLGMEVYLLQLPEPVYNQLQQDVQRLEIIYAEYLSHIQAVRKLIVKYEQLHKYIRADLRRQQLIRKKKEVAVQELINDV